ncbi:hypothetical protein H6G36_02345 [Anabaena minutissima FACHB-250]|nr:hypothetical protein [Anabaena minutissima FACHB-250]
MSLPTTTSGIKYLAEITKLSREFGYYAKGVKQLADSKALKSQFTAIKNGTTTARKLADTATKKVGVVEKVQNKLLEKVPGGGNSLDKAGKAGGSLAALIAIGGVAAIVAIQALLQRVINDSTLNDLDYLRSETQKSFDRYQKTVIAIRSVEAQVKQFKQEDQRTRDRIYAVEKQQPKIREDANNALYETRQGRKIIDGQLAKYASDIAALKSQFEKLLGTANNNFQKTIETTIASLQKALQQANSQIESINTKVNKPGSTNDIVKLNSEIEKLNNRVVAAEKITKTVPSAIQKAVEISGDTTVKAVNAAFAPIQQAQRRWGVSVTPATVTPAQITYSEGGIVVPRLATVTPAQVTYSDFSTSDIGLQIKVNQERADDTLKRQITATAGGVSTAFEQIAQARAIADAALREAKIKGVPDTSQLESRLKETDRQLAADISGLKTRIGDIDRVNEAGNKKLDQFNGKLDQIIPLLGLIPGRVATTIKPNLLTAPQIEAATGNAICKSLNGGCGKASVDDAVSRINQHNTNNTGSVLDAVNTGANAALLTGQQTILARLGDQLPGGIGGKLTRFSQWLQLDRALNLLTFAATVHNAFQLSNDIAVTLGSALSNVLQLIGIKNDEGGALDIGQIINSTVENLVKGIVGAENYQQMSETFAKANRIYQATTNVLNSFLNLSQTILQASELIAAYTGRIGNALRKSGEVLESAYGWMNPQPKFNRVTQFLEGLQNGASTIQMVTQAPLDVVNATTEFTTAATDFVKAVKEDDKPENQPTPTPEPDQLKAVETASKLVSAGLELIDLDFEADE